MDESMASRQRANLERHRPVLIENTDFSVVFWAHLRRRNIVTALHEEIKHTLPNSEQAAWFYDYLQKRPDLDLHLVCQALVETHQQHVACLFWDDGNTAPDEIPLHVIVLHLMRPDIINTVRVDGQFWNRLSEMDVLKEGEIDILKMANSTALETLDQFVNHLLVKSSDIFDRFIASQEDQTREMLQKMKTYWENKLNYKATCTIVQQPVSYDMEYSEESPFKRMKLKIANHYKSHRGKIFVWPYGPRLKWENVHCLFTETTCSRKTDIHSETCGSISTLASIFKKDIMRKQILLQGQPGMGKTTLVNWALTCWAESALSRCREETNTSHTAYPRSNNFDYDLMIALSLGQVESGSTLDDTITKQVGLKINSDEAKVLKQFISNYPERVIFVLDALDELDLGASPSVINLITGSVYEHASRVVTSRHTAAGSQTEALVEGYDTILELEGFEDFCHVEGYIEKYFHNPEKAEQALSLITEIKANVNLRSLCQVPLHLHLMCLLWEAGEELGKRKTDLYIRILRYTLDIYTAKKTRKKKVHLDDLSEHHDDLLQYGDLALKGLMRKQKRFFFSGECELNVKKTLNKGCKAGIMLHMEPDFFGDCKERVKFQHLSLQELVAAYFLWKSEKAFKCFLKHVYTVVRLHNFRNTITFLCGFSEERGNQILKHANEVVKQCKEEPPATQCPYFNPLAWASGKVNWQAPVYPSTNLSCFFAQCLQEYKDKSLCDVSLPEELIIELPMVTECKALLETCRYNNSRTALKILVINNGSLGREDLKLLFANKRMELREMNGLYLRNLERVDDIALIGKILTTVYHLLYLRVDIKQNTVKDARCVLNGIRYPAFLIRMNIVHLNIKNDRELFIKRMSGTSFLVKLYLGSMDLSILGEQVVSLFTSKFLVLIVLEDTKLTHDQLTLIFDALPRRCPDLLELSLSGNDMSQSLKSLSRCLIRLHHLERLLLRRCSLSPSDLNLLLQCESRSLWCLDITDNLMKLDPDCFHLPQPKLGETCVSCKGIWKQDTGVNVPDLIVLSSSTTKIGSKQKYDEKLTNLQRRIAECGIRMSVGWNVVIFTLRFFIHCLIDYFVPLD